MGFSYHVLYGNYSNVLILHTEAKAQMTQEKHNLGKKHLQDMRRQSTSPAFWLL